MTHLIDKAALVAELERIEHETNYEPFTGEVLGKRCACKSLLSFLDTHEVKEVDLEKEIDKEIETRWRGEYLFTSKFRESAKHFFELGLKVQKEE